MVAELLVEYASEGGAVAGAKPSCARMAPAQWTHLFLHGQLLIRTQKWVLY